MASSYNQPGTDRHMHNAATAQPIQALAEALIPYYMSKKILLLLFYTLFFIIILYNSTLYPALLIHPQPTVLYSVSTQTDSVLA